jgi:hypothetical protein
VTTVPRISYARSADGVSLAFTTAGHGPALVFVPWVPFSNFRTEWQSTLLGEVTPMPSPRPLHLVGPEGRDGTRDVMKESTDMSTSAVLGPGRTGPPGPGRPCGRSSNGGTRMRALRFGDNRREE